MISPESYKMNKISTKKIEESYKLRHTIKREGGNVICDEEWANGKLVKQSFRLTKKIHNTYEASKMQFRYYGGPVDFESMGWDEIHTNYCKNIKKVFVTDLKLFNDFDNLYCNWVGMDDKIFRLTEKDCLLIQHRIDLPESRFDINGIVKALKGNEQVIITKERDTLVIKYKVTRDMLNDPHYAYWKEDVVVNHLGLSSFKKAELPDDYDYLDY